MRRSRGLITTLGLAAVAASGAAALITIGGSTTAVANRTTPQAAGVAASHIAGARAAPQAAVRTATAWVGGVAEEILVNRDGLPLYTYEPDTATASMVNGELAALWPPLTANTAGAGGAPGKLAIVTTANGPQVTFNGHFLYTFVEDSPGVVTGQGVQNFMVARPTTPSIGSSSTSAGTAPRASSSGSVPGY